MFSRFGHKGNYDAEMKRHDLAEEKLDAARHEWNDKRNAVWDKLHQRKEELKRANTDLEEVEKNLETYHKAFIRQLRGKSHGIEFTCNCFWVVWV